MLRGMLLVVFSSGQLEGGRIFQCEQPALHIKTEMEDVTVFDLIICAFNPQFAGIFCPASPWQAI